MKKKFTKNLIAVILMSFPILGFAKDPNLGTTADFVLFSSNGSVSNTGISQLTGNVGSNNGASTAFGNVNGVMHDNDGASGLCATDLLVLCGDIDKAIPTFFPAPLLGNGTTFTAGIYSTTAVTTLNDTLFLDGQNKADAVFIFKIGAAFATGANAYVKLINGARASNVYWKIEGLVSLASGTTMRGTIIANNAAIEMNTGVTLEGRALTTAGAIVVDGVLAYTPVIAGVPLKTGPVAPDLLTTSDYALFSLNGEVTNSGVTHLTGDCGTNVGLTTGFQNLNVSGFVHPIPDVSTSACAADLLVVYNYLNLLPNDIELLYPAQFGRNLVLTPHTYIMNSAATFTDSLYLNAEGNPDAVFVIKINGAMETSTFAKVLLINGTQAKNVYWLVQGALGINDYSIMNGTFICNNGAININSGTILNGRALTTDGALRTAAIFTTMTSSGVITAVKVPASNKSEVVVYNTGSHTFSMAIHLNESESVKSGIMNLYDIVGKSVKNVNITEQSTVIDVNLPLGIYFYKLALNNGTVQTGKAISK